jgi:hypothetical protein
LKKIKKKACHRPRPSLRPDAGGQTGLFKCSKKIEKKACQVLKSLINATLDLTKPMEKLMIKNVLNKLGFVRIALVASVGFPFIVASNASAQTSALRRALAAVLLGTLPAESSV